MSSRLSIAIRIFLVIAITVGSLLAAAVPAFGQAPGTPSQDATETTVPVTATQTDSQPNSFFPTYYSLNIYVNGNGWTSPYAGYHSGYSSGTIVSISATPAEGWTFAGWSGPVWNSSQASTAVTMNSNVTVTANFIQTYSLTMAVNGNGWTSPGVGSYPGYSSGTIVSLNATPAPGWYFAGWTGPVWNSDASTAVTMNSNVTVTANFMPETYNLFMAAAPSAGGSTTPTVGSHSGYGHGSVVPISATPSAGWTFVNWTGLVAAPDNASTTVTMNSDVTVTANFIQTYSLTLAVNGNGSTNPAVGAYTGYSPGTTVSISATPAPGWVFASWTGPAWNAGQPSTQVTINSNITVTANFIPTYTLTMVTSPVGAGTTAPPVGASTGYTSGALVNITATPLPGWTFVNWTGPVAFPANPATTVTINSDVTLTANFIQTYSLTLAVNGNGSTTPIEGLHTGYAPGTVVPVTATPLPGWTFVNWTGDTVADANDPTTTITMDGDKTVTANFTQAAQTYTLTMAVNGNGWTAPGLGYYQGYSSGTIVSIHAWPLPGWTFVNWTGPVVDPNNPNTSVTVNGNVTVTANFTPTSTYTLTMAANPAGGGATTPPVGTHTGYAPGTVVPVTATPLPGWTFVNWTGPVAATNTPSTTVTMNSDIAVTAIFVPSYTLTMTVSPVAAGTTTPPVGTPTGYNAGTMVTISATPLPGWTFVNWTGPVAVPANAATTVTMNSDVTLIANFAQAGQAYDLTIATAPVGGGTTTPAEGSLLGLAPGTVVNISATPNAGWTFMFWTTSVVGSVADENAASTTVTVNTHMTVMANFTQASQTYTLTMAVDPAEGGSTTPPVGLNGPFASGTAVNINATPASGYTFVNWTGPVADPDNPNTSVVLSVAVNTNITVTANFTQGGAVETDTFPNSVVQATLLLPVGTPVTLGPAAPSVSRVFFYGPAAGDAHDDDGDLLDEVPTELLQLNLVGSGPAAGVLVRESPTLASLGLIEENGSITTGRLDLPPFAPSGTIGSFFDVFLELSVDGGATWTPATAPLHLAGTLHHQPAAPGDFYQSMPGAVVEFPTPGGTFGLQLPRYTPDPAPAQTYTLTMAVNGNGSTTPIAGLHTGYAPGTVVPVTATPLPGWTFVNWTGLVAAPANAATTVTMNSDVTVTANFTQAGQAYDLTIATAPVGGGTTTPAEGSYLGLAPGTVVNISATPNAGWTFMFWTTSVVGSVADENAASTTVTVNTHMTVMANFIRTSTYTLTMAVEPADSGFTTPAIGAHAGYVSGAFLDVTATPNQGWEFVNWTGPVADPSNPTTEVIMDADMTVTAHFAQNGPDVPLSLAPSSNNVMVGQVFNVTVSTNLAAGQNVSAVDAFVDFDPTKLEVIDADPDTEGVQIADGALLTTHMGNVVDNDAGTIDYSVGKLSGTTPSGSFLVATISFRALGDTGATATPITISLSGVRISIVAYNGSAYTGAHIDSSAAITFDVPLSLLPATNNVTIGQVFPVTINTNAPAGVEISAVDAFVNFDPALLEVVDADPATAGVQIAANGSDLPVAIANTVDNVLGHIGFSADASPMGVPNGSFLVATINFRAKSESEGTPITISLGGARQSNVSFSGAIVPGTHANSAAVIVYDVPLSLTASGPKAYVDTTFTVTIQTTAAVGQLISAVDTFVDFDPAYLEVVDADPDTEGVQIADGALLTTHLGNVVDNDAGTIDYSAGKLTSPPSGSFLVATITFRAKADTAGMNTTPISISLTTPRKSLVAFNGSPVAGSHVDTAVDVDPGATIYGHLTLQGGARPAANRVVQLTVKLFPAGQYTGNTIVNGTTDMVYTPWTINTGSNNVTFQIDGVVAGTYDILLVAGHTLHSVKRGVVVSPPSVDVYFGTLLEGNANNDTIINALDFSILAAAYMKSAGQSGWNAGADFDMTGTVNALDFSLLAANYMRSSPQAAP